MADFNVSGAIAAESCQHFVTMFGDYSPMTRDKNINAVIQGLRERIGLPAACMKAAKIEWPRPLAIGRLAHVAIANAPCLSSVSVPGAVLIAPMSESLSFRSRLTRVPALQWPGVVRGPLKITVALQSADNPALSVQAIDINPIPDNRPCIR